MSTNKKAPSAKSKAGSPPYRPARGYDFEIQEREVRVRERLAYAFISGAAMALIGSVIYGFQTGGFQGTSAVWSLISPFLGMVMGYYFHAARNRRSGS